MLRAPYRSRLPLRSLSAAWNFCSGRNPVRILQSDSWIQPVGSVRKFKHCDILTRKGVHYQENLMRLPVCTLLAIDTPLHLADRTEGWGPMCNYWFYLTERSYSHLKNGGAASERFPYKSLDHYVFDWATLWPLGAIYDIRDGLKLRHETGGDDDSRI